jgi:hypothetical protein
MAERLRPIERPSFQDWVASVERRLERQLGLTLADLPSDTPLTQGFACGDTPAEFVTGTVFDLLDLNELGE